MTQVVKANVLRIDTTSVFVTIKIFFITIVIVKLFKNGYWWVGVNYFRF